MSPRIHVAGRGLLLVLALLPAMAAAQISETTPDPATATMGEAKVGLFKVGAEITASRGACRNVKAMVAVPLECPEQEVRIVEEDFSGEVDQVTYRDLGGARQMLITVPSLSSGAVARAVVTFEVRTKPVLPPDDNSTAKFSIPKKPARELRQFLMASPYIDARDGKVRTAAREAWESLSADATDWQRVEALYDYMLNHIRYTEGDDKSAVDTLRDGYADCYGRSAVFIAMCRANKVPARVVWVNKHCYAEFYLEDETGTGTWFPIESAGSRAFGEMPLARPILQKGDNFRVPERKGERLRYATDFITGVPVPGAGQPRVKYIREQIE